MSRKPPPAPAPDRVPAPGPVEGGREGREPAASRQVEVTAWPSECARGAAEAGQGREGGRAGGARAGAGRGGAAPGR